MSQILFQCSGNCPRIRSTGAEAGYVMPNDLAPRLPQDRETIAAQEGLKVVGTRQCTHWLHNGADEAIGECYLRGARPETL